MISSWVSRKLTKEDYVLQCTETHGDRFDYSDLVYMDGKVTINCRIHGPFEQRPSDHRRGFGCPKCPGKARGTTEGFIAKAREVHGDFYGYSKTVYESASREVIVTCPKHGDFVIKRAGWHIHGTATGCSVCCRSKGELAIQKYLETHNVQFEAQKRLDGFKTKAFDFYLEDRNMCIEFDGAQHFYAKHHPTKNKEKAQKSFEDTQRRDHEKTDFCKSHSIRLLRIPYTSINDLETILEHEIFLHSTE